MLDEYKELCKRTADNIPDWNKLTKNELCRAYIANKHDEDLRNSYFSAILYRYWGLINKYYYMSANCATPEDCYEWLVDSVSCCVNLASWEDPKSSIYGDPNGPDKVINRCMKCARLTYYQFINRKKRKDEFGSLSIEELKDLYGADVSDDIDDHNQDVDISSIVIKQYVHEIFRKKDYFLAFMIDAILSNNVFDAYTDYETHTITSELNIRKLCNELKHIEDPHLVEFSNTYGLPKEEVYKAHKYINGIPSSLVRKKVLQSLDKLKHSDFIKSLRGSRYYVN